MPGESWPLWEGVWGAISDDGKSLAVVAGDKRDYEVPSPDFEPKSYSEVPYRERLLLLREKNGWRKQVVLDVYCTWKVELWRDWLVVGVWDKDEQQVIHLFRLDNLSETFVVRADQFCGL